MKTTAWWTLTLPLALFVSGQLGSQALAQTNSTSTEIELLRIAKDYPRVLDKRDAETIKKLEDDDIIIIDSDGTVGNKARDVKEVADGTVTFAKWEMLGLRVKVLNADAAIVSGRYIVTGGKWKGPSGKMYEFSGRFRFVDTYVRRAGQWKLAATVTVRVPVVEEPRAPNP